MVSSPNYPGNYPHNKECVWTIEADPGIVITVNFTAFHLEGGSCSFDSLELRLVDFVIEDITVILPYKRCSKSLWPGHGRSRDTIQCMRILHLSRKGFQISLLSWYTLFEQAYPKCINNWNDRISQPVLPGIEVAKSGGPKIIYYKLIKGVIGICINMTLKLFVCVFLHAKMFLYWQFLTMFTHRNGGFPNSPLIGEFCGNSITPTSFTSHTNKMYIKFKTDGSVSYSGFSFNFDATASGKWGRAMSSNRTTIPNKE